jgi:hypothetical protein
LAEYDDDDDDLDHLVCYTKLQPRMASFVRWNVEVHGWDFFTATWSLYRPDLTPSSASANKQKFFFVCTH